MIPRLEQIIPVDGGDVRAVPFPRAFRTRHARLYDPASVSRVLCRPPVLEEVDPTRLWANQPLITRPGVAYYLSDEYARTGRTYADFDQRANRYPLVHRRTHPRTGEDQLVILSGHHRSTAALIEDRPVLARIVDDSVVETNFRRPIAITPSLWLARHDDPVPLPQDVTLIRAVDDARTHLARRGLSHAEIVERIRFAHADTPEGREP